MGEYMKKQCVSRTFDRSSNAPGQASFTVILNVAQFKNRVRHKVTAFGDTQGEIQREADSSNHKCVAPVTKVVQREQPKNLEEDKTFCLKMLGLQDDGNLPEIEVFDDTVRLDDCSGFVQQVYKHFGYSLPRSSSEQRSAGREVSYSEAQPGDLICYAGHVAIYIGNGQIVHASTPTTGIKVGTATYRTILSVRRIV